MPSRRQTAPSSPKSAFDDSGRGVKGLFQRARSKSRSRAAAKGALKKASNNPAFSPASPAFDADAGFESPAVSADMADTLDAEGAEFEDEFEDGEQQAGRAAEGFSSEFTRAKSPPPAIALPSLPPFTFTNASAPVSPTPRAAPSALRAADLRHSLALLDSRLASLRDIGAGALPRPAADAASRAGACSDDEEELEATEDDEDGEGEDEDEPSWTVGRATRVVSRRLSSFQLPAHADSDLPAGLFGSPGEGGSLWDALGFDLPKFSPAPSRSSLPYAASSNGRSSVATSSLVGSGSRQSIASGNSGLAPVTEAAVDSSSATVRASLLDAAPLSTHDSLDSLASLNSVGSGGSSSSDEFNIKDFPSFEDYARLGELPDSAANVLDSVPVSKARMSMAPLAKPTRTRESSATATVREDDSPTEHDTVDGHMSFPFPPTTSLLGDKVEAEEKTEDESDVVTPKVGPPPASAPAQHKVDPVHEALFEALASMSGEGHNPGLGLGLFGDDSHAFAPVSRFGLAVADPALDRDEDDSDYSPNSSADLSSGSSLGTSTAPSSTNTNANNSFGSELLHASVAGPDRDKDKDKDKDKAHAQQAHLPDAFKAAALPLPPSPSPSAAALASPFQESTFLSAFPRAYTPSSPALAVPRSPRTASVMFESSAVGPAGRASPLPGRMIKRVPSPSPHSLARPPGLKQSKSMGSLRRTDEPAIPAEWAMPLPMRAVPAPPAFEEAGVEAKPALDPSTTPAPASPKAAATPPTPKMRRSISQRFSFSLRKRKSELNIASISAPLPLPAHPACGPEPPALPPLPGLARAPASAPLPSSSSWGHLRKSKSNPKLSAQLASRSANPAARLPPSPALPSGFTDPLIAAAASLNAGAAGERALGPAARTGPGARARGLSVSVSGAGEGVGATRKRFSLFLPSKFGTSTPPLPLPLPLPSPSPTWSVTQFGQGDDASASACAPELESSSGKTSPVDCHADLTTPSTLDFPPSASFTDDLAPSASPSLSTRAPSANGDHLPLPSPTFSERSGTSSPSLARSDQRLSLAAFIKDSPKELIAKRPARTSSFFHPMPALAGASRPATPALVLEQERLLRGDESIEMDMRAFVMQFEPPVRHAPSPVPIHDATAAAAATSDQFGDLSMASTLAADTTASIAAESDDDASEPSSSEDDTPLGAVPGALKAQKSLRVTRYREKRALLEPAKHALKKSPSGPFDLELDTRQTGDGAGGPARAMGLAAKNPSLPLERVVERVKAMAVGPARSKTLPANSGGGSASAQQAVHRVRPQLTVAVDAAKAADLGPTATRYSPKLVPVPVRPAPARSATLPSPRGGPSSSPGPSPAMSRNTSASSAGPSPNLLTVPHARPSRPAGREHRVFIDSHLRHITVAVSATTVVREVVEGARAQGLLSSGSDAQGGFALWEICRALGVERPLREFEVVADVVKSWDGEANILIIKRSFLWPVLASSLRAQPAPSKSGWVQVELRPGKWAKKWLELRDASLTAAKGESGKDRTQLVPLASFDAFAVAPHTVQALKPPKPFVIALKSRLPRSHFEKEQEYCIFIGLRDEQEHDAWLKAITEARNPVMRERETAVLGAAATSPETKGTAPLLAPGQVGAVPATASSLARASTTKKSITRPPPPTLLPQPIEAVVSVDGIRPATAPVGGVHGARPEPRVWNTMDEGAKKQWLKEAEKQARDQKQTFLQLA